MKRTGLLVILSVIAGLVLLAADAKKPLVAMPTQDQQVRTVDPVQPGLAPVVRPETGQEEAQPASGPDANFNLDWYSINSGGVVDAASTNYRAGVSVGQAAAGEAASPNYRMQIGFWAGVFTGGGACPITLTGDVNLTGAINSSDIIYLVNFVFKAGAEPLPCSASSDVNCTGAVNSSDIIYLVNFVFKGGAAPCDGCTSDLAAAC